MSMTVIATRRQFLRPNAAERGTRVKASSDKQDLTRRSSTYENFLRENWFGEAEAYNLPMLETITEGRTTRLVKETTTGNILLGYKEEVALNPSQVQTVKLGQAESTDIKAPVIVEAPEPSNLIPGDILLQIKAADATVDCSEMPLDEIKSILASGPKEILVRRELFKPAWLEPKVTNGRERLCFFFHFRLSMEAYDQFESYDMAIMLMMPMICEIIYKKKIGVG